MNNLERITKKLMTGKIARKLSALALAGLMQLGCSKILDANLIVNLPEGPYTYPIVVQNENSGDMNNPEGSDMWINWGETEGFFKLNSGQSYLIKAVGFPGYRITQDGRLELLRYDSNEEYAVLASPGETCEVDFTMKDEPRVISFD
ncbi:MAG: hypothetical protein Q7S06_00635 [Nanoarchaeota archaeon]|nr:hypothetical protein [Nanoarchaeota archaeon]